MSTLIIMTFDTENRAFDVLEEIKKDEKEKQFEIEDAVVATKDQHGKVHVKETRDFTTKRGALTGGALGLAIGAVLAGPIGVIAVTGLGALAGGLTSKAVDLGFSKDQIDMVSQSMHEGNSAIFLMLKGGKSDLLAAWANHAPGHLVEFTVTEDAQVDASNYMATVGHINE